jgi:FMN phosphatase YigB (HAD superfamily)
VELQADRIRVIVYDLDGTVYDDTRHFEIYSRLIQEQLPPDVREVFWQDYAATVAGHHPALAIGCFYDRERDLVLRLKGGKVARVLRWDGAEVDAAQWREWYPGVVEPDHQRIMNVGDLWWVPTAVSAHYGGISDRHHQCFLRMREIMADESFDIRPIPGFRDLVLALKGKAIQVLATNSPQPDSEAILTKVGLRGLLDGHYFQSNKPVGLKRILAELAGIYGCGMDAILSIGDNLVNEITPARALGCQTVFIDPHGLGDADDADLVVRDMAELMPRLRGMFMVK